MLGARKIIFFLPCDRLQKISYDKKKEKTLYTVYVVRAVSEADAALYINDVLKNKDQKLDSLNQQKTTDEKKFTQSKKELEAEIVFLKNILNNLKQPDEAKPSRIDPNEERSMEINHKLDELLGKISTTTTNIAGDEYLLTDQILFDFAKTDFTDTKYGRNNSRILQDIIKDILENQKNIKTIRIYGYSDRIPPINNTTHSQFGEKRAIAVKEYMLEMGVRKELIETKGFGPVNIDAKSDYNRRVEIYVLF